VLCRNMYEDQLRPPDVTDCSFINVIDLILAEMKMVLTQLVQGT